MKKLWPPWKLFKKIQESLVDNPTKVNEEIITVVQYCDEVLQNPKLLAIMMNYHEAFTSPQDSEIQGIAMALGKTLQWEISGTDQRGFYVSQRQRLQQPFRQEHEIIQVFEKHLVEYNLLDKNTFMYAWNMRTNDTEEYDNIPSLAQFFLNSTQQD